MWDPAKGSEDEWEEVAVKAGEKGGLGESKKNPQRDSTPLSSRTKMEAVEKMDPDEEKARLDLLLRDDFIDDLTSGGFMPVQLPMVETGSVLTHEDNFIGVFIQVTGNQNSRVRLSTLAS